MNTSRPVLSLDEYSSDAELAAVELFIGYPDALLKFVGVCCIIYILIGVPGNLITIISLVRFKQIQNATAIFIINLAVADLLFSALVLPMVVFSYWTRSWTHGRVLCRIYPLINHIFVLVSLYNVVLIAINRYVLICHPIRYCSIYTKRNIYIMISTIWIALTGILLLPFFGVWGQMSLDPNTGACTMVSDKNGGNPKKLIVSMSIFLCLSIIAACYIRILIVVKRSVKRAANARVPGAIEVDCTTNYYTNTEAPADDDISFSSDETQVHEGIENVAQLTVEPSNRPKTPKKQLPSKKDKKLLTMVWAVMVCVIGCYLPITLIKVVYKKIDTSPTFNMMAYVLVYFAPCVNPVLYVLMSKEYRQAYKSLLQIKNR